MEIVSCLLPDSTHLRLNTWQWNEAENQITLTVVPIQRVAHCPVCDGAAIPAGILTSVVATVRSFLSFLVAACAALRAAEAVLVNVSA
jgi:hypothetical protein